MSDPLPIEARFTLEARVGRGATGEVFRAVDRETGRTVAVKRMLASSDDPTLLDRFQREARLLAQVDHPHVVRYVAHGVDEGGRPCLVVEWLDGEDLARRQRRQRLTPRERSTWSGRPRSASTRCTRPASSTATSSPRTSTWWRAAPPRAART
jgi:serine/threonine protein kinase